MGAKKLSIHWAIHHHQPVGNLENVFEEVYQRSYFPLMSAVLATPCVRLHVSYSAPVLRFLEKKHPEYFEMLHAMQDENRLEILATGFYEPVLADIAEADRSGQLELSKLWYRERMGTTPQGVWLSESVWDKSLIGTFRRAGLDHTIIPAERFLQAGWIPARLHGYFITEELGETVKVFPNCEELLQLIPFSPVDETTNFLRRCANRGGIALTMADVAERWGAWPGTHERIFTNGQIQRLMELFTQSADWLRFRLFSETIQSTSPQGSCYLPGGTNTELGAWSLPDEARIRFYEAKKELETRHDAARFLPFFRSGSWENFRQRFSESNLMQKKGLWLRKKLWQAGSADPVVRDWLWQAQCNTAYWHGTSGGIYSPNLREAVWERLLSAQRRLQLADKNWKMERVDFDGDGLDEILCYNDCCSVGIGMAHGGSLFEWSTLPALHNYSNTLTRRRETAPQHLPHVGIETRDSGVPGDLHERRSFLDRILDRQVTVSQLTSGKLPDRARFIFENYRLVRFGVEQGTAEVVNEAVGMVEQGGAHHTLRIRKTFRLPPEGHHILCCVELTNESSVELDGVFASELNFSLSPHQEEITVAVSGRPTRLLQEAYYGEAVSSVTFTDRKFHLGVSVESEKPFLLWACPLVTRSPDSKALPLMQGHLLTAGWPFRLTAGTATRFDFHVSTPNVFHKMID